MRKLFAKIYALAVTAVCLAAALPGAVRAAEAEAAPRRAAAADSGGVKCSTELNSIGL